VAAVVRRTTKLSDRDLYLSKASKTNKHPSDFFRLKSIHRSVESKTIQTVSSLGDIREVS